MYHMVDNKTKFFFTRPQNVRPSLEKYQQGFPHRQS